MTDNSEPRIADHWLKREARRPERRPEPQHHKKGGMHVGLFEAWLTATHEGNRGKKHQRISSRYQGVSWNPRRRLWIAQLYHEKTTTYLGGFPREKDAATAYDAKARALGFPRDLLNFPDMESTP